MTRKTSWISDGHPKKAQALKAICFFLLFWLGVQMIQMGSAVWGAHHHPELGNLSRQTLYLNTYPAYYLLPYLLWVGACLFLLQRSGLKLFSRERPGARFLAGVLTGLVLLMIVQVLMSSLTTALYPEQAEPVNQAVIVQAMGEMPAWKMVLVLVILPAVTEETFTRGLVMRYIFPSHPFVGILVSSLIFASMHATDLWLHFLTYFLLGSCLG